MSRQSLRLTLLLVCCSLAWAAHAEAQIYAWHDARGTLVLSDRPLDPRAVTIAVPGTAEIRTTGAPVRAEVVAQYEPLIRQHATSFGVRAELVRAVIQVESGFDRWAVSPKGAMGLMQLMPHTARALGVSNAFDPAENIRGGVQYLRSLLGRYGGDEELALAAYNAGPEAVARYGGRVPPYRETRSYVARITQVARPSRSTVIYKTVDLIDGRAVPRFTNVKPVSGAYEIAGER